MSYVSKEVSKGRFVSITLRLDTDGERRAYQALLRGDNITCPKCGSTVNPKNEDMCIKAISPLSDFFGMELGRVATRCDQCGEVVEPTQDIDLSAFPSAIAFLHAFRKEYKKRMLAKKGGK